MILHRGFFLEGGGWVRGRNRDQLRKDELAARSKRYSKAYTPHLTMERQKPLSQ